MKPISDGKSAEARARLLFKNQGYSVQQIDWLAIREDKVICVEVKDKAEPFKKPPFDGHGLDKRQVWLRMQLLDHIGLRTYLLVFDNSGQVYGQYLDALELGESFDTKNGIRIYPLKSFNIIKGGI